MPLDGDSSRTVFEQSSQKKIGASPVKILICMIMPDAVVTATERQFSDLIVNAGCKKNRAVEIYFFTLPIFKRSDETLFHMAEKKYKSFDEIKEIGLDAVIITGASEESNPQLTVSNYWEPLKEFIAWAKESVSSIFYSCHAANAGMYFEYNQEPLPRDEKALGIFEYNNVSPRHPLVKGMNGKIVAPQSHIFTVELDGFTRNKISILFSDDKMGVLLAFKESRLYQDAPDNPIASELFSSGHLEYDEFSISKEYKRDVIDFIEGRRKLYPSLPYNYYNEEGTKIAEQYKELVAEKLKDITILSEQKIIIQKAEIIAAFPEKELTRSIIHSYKETAKVLFQNWIEHICDAVDRSLETSIDSAPTQAESATLFIIK